MADYGSSPAVDSVRQSGEQPRSNVSSSSSSTEEEGGDSPVGSPPMISDCSDIYDLVLQCRTEPLGKDNVGNVDVEEEDLLLMLEDESPPLPLPTNPPPTSVVTQSEGRRSRSTSPSWSRSAGSRSRSVSPSPERNHQDDSGIVQVSASASTDLDSLETTSICTSVTTTITTTRIVVYEEGEGPDEDRLVVVSTDKDEANLEEAEGIAVVDDEPLVDFGDVEDGLVVGEVAVVVGRDRRGSSDDSGTGVEVDVSSTPSPLPPSGVDGPGQQLEDASGSSDDEVVVEDAEEGLAVDEGWCGEDREGSHKPLLLDACEKVPVISDDGPVEHSHDAHDGSSSSGDEECRGADDVGGKTGKKKKMKVSSEPEPQPLVIADEQENVDPKPDMANRLCDSSDNSDDDKDVNFVKIVIREERFGDAIMSSDEDTFSDASEVLEVREALIQGVYQEGSKDGHESKELMKIDNPEHSCDDALVTCDNKLDSEDKGKAGAADIVQSVVDVKECAEIDSGDSSSGEEAELKPVVTLKIIVKKDSEENSSGSEEDGIEPETALVQDFDPFDVTHKPEKEPGSPIKKELDSDSDADSEGPLESSVEESGHVNEGQSGTNEGVVRNGLDVAKYTEDHSSDSEVEGCTETIEFQGVTSIPVEGKVVIDVKEVQLGKVEIVQNNVAKKESDSEDGTKKDDKDKSDSCEKDERIDEPVKVVRKGSESFLEKVAELQVEISVQDLDSEHKTDGRSIGSGSDSEPECDTNIPSNDSSKDDDSDKEEEHSDVDLVKDPLVLVEINPAAEVGDVESDSDSEKDVHKIQELVEDSRKAGEGIVVDDEDSSEGCHSAVEETEGSKKSDSESESDVEEKIEEVINVLIAKKVQAEKTGLFYTKIEQISRRHDSDSGSNDTNSPVEIPHIADDDMVEKIEEKDVQLTESEGVVEVKDVEGSSDSEGNVQETLEEIKEPLIHIGQELTDEVQKESFNSADVKEKSGDDKFDKSDLLLVKDSKKSDVESERNVNDIGKEHSSDSEEDVRERLEEIVTHDVKVEIKGSLISENVADEVKVVVHVDVKDEKMEGKDIQLKEHSESADEVKREVEIIVKDISSDSEDDAMEKLDEIASEIVTVEMKEPLIINSQDITEDKAKFEDFRLTKDGEESDVKAERNGKDDAQEHSSDCDDEAEENAKDVAKEHGSDSEDGVKEKMVDVIVNVGSKTDSEMEAILVQVQVDSSKCHFKSGNSSDSEDDIQDKLEDIVAKGVTEVKELLIDISQDICKVNVNDVQEGSSKPNDVMEKIERDKIALLLIQDSEDSDSDVEVERNGKDAAKGHTSDSEDVKEKFEEAATKVPEDHAKSTHSSDPEYDGKEEQGRITNVEMKIDLNEGNDKPVSGEDVKLEVNVLERSSDSEDGDIEVGEEGKNDLHGKTVDIEIVSPECNENEPDADILVVIQGSEAAKQRESSSIENETETNAAKESSSIVRHHSSSSDEEAKEELVIVKGHDSDNAIVSTDKDVTIDSSNRADDPAEKPIVEGGPLSMDRGCPDEEGLVRAVVAQVSQRESSDGEDDDDSQGERPELNADRQEMKEVGRDIVDMVEEIINIGKEDSSDDERPNVPIVDFSDSEDELVDRSPKVKFAASPLEVYHAQVVDIEEIEEETADLSKGDLNILNVLNLLHDAELPEDYDEVFRDPLPKCPSSSSLSEDDYDYNDLVENYYIDYDVEDPNDREGLKNLTVRAEPWDVQFSSDTDEKDTDEKDTQLERKRSSSSVSEGMENGSHEVDAEVIPTGISIKELKSVYVKPQIADDSYPHVSKEVIETGISLVNLRASYCNHAKDEDESKLRREVIETGVSIKALRALSHGDLSSLVQSPTSEKSAHTYVTAIDRVWRTKSHSDLTAYEEEKLHRKTINTGVNVKALKSSFNSSDGGDSVISESEGVKIDRAKVTRQFSQESCPLYALLEATETSGKEEKSSNCRICGKQVFHMEKVKAERGVFHKTCFRCRECGKQLTVDNYSSHEGVIYCKPHFKTLFQPKAKFDEEPRAPRRKHEMIIKENTPAELPPDVARSADKPDHGLNELPSLRSIKSRFEGSDSDLDASRTSSSVPVKRSESILNRISKFQELADENGHHEHTDSSSEEEDEDEEDGRDPRVLREKRTKEKVVFSGMSDLKNQWECGDTSIKELRARERQDEMAKLRARICSHGKGSLKLRYESAVEESHRSTTSTGVLPADVNIELTKAKNMKDKFEKGDLANETEQEKAERVRAAEREEDLSVFKEQGTAVDARNLFKHMEANTKSATTPSPTAPLPAQSVKRSPSLRARELLCSPDEVVKSGSTVEEDPTASIETPALSARFKFFENFEDEIQRRQPERRAFRMTPPREAAKEESPEPLARRDPNVVRACDAYEDDTAVVADTARKMRDKFRELESQAEREPSPGAPKPLKRITPPREFTKDGSGSDSEPDTRRDPNVVRACDKVEDDFLAEAQKAAHKAKNLTARFEHWDRNGNGKAGSDDEEDGDRDRRNGEQEQKPEPDTTKNLKAKFEALKDESAKVPHKAKANVKRFIDHAGSEECDLCGKRVYPVERLDVSGHKIHKTCFRCSHCGNVLRMDNYTSSEGVLYCTPHFKQLFIARGNYDEGFGREQHKDRWNRSRSSTPTPKELNGQGTEQFVFGD